MFNDKEKFENLLYDLQLESEGLVSMTRDDAVDLVVVHHHAKALREKIQQCVDIV